MIKHTEVMKMALDALGQLWLFSDETAVIAKPAITALREALALVNKVDQEQPAQRQARSADTWVGLTDEEILIMSRYDLEYAALIGEVQRKLKEKNT